MPPQLKGALLLILIALVGLVGMALIVALVLAWRRQIDRERRVAAKHAGRKPLPTDIWRESASRLGPAADEPEKG